MAKETEKRPTVAERIAAGTFGEPKKRYGARDSGGADLEQQRLYDKKQRRIEALAQRQIDADVRADGNSWEAIEIDRRTADKRDQPLDTVFRG